MCMLGHRIFKAVFGTCQGTSLFIVSMRLLVLVMNVCPFYLINYEMCEWIKDETDKYLIRQLFNVMVLLTLIAYYTASCRRPKVIPQLAAAGEN